MANVQPVGNYLEIPEATKCGQVALEDNVVL